MRNEVHIFSRFGFIHSRFGRACLCYARFSKGKNVCVFVLFHEGLAHSNNIFYLLQQCLVVGMLGTSDPIVHNSQEQKQEASKGGKQQ